MWTIFIIVVVIIFAFYYVIFKDYIDVKKVFNTLEKTLNTRDLLVMKLLPEIKDKNLQANIASLIEERTKNRNISYNDKINIDIKLNKELKIFYDIINKKLDNQVIKATFKNVIETEKILKKIRSEYNLVVEKYNMNLVMHKFLCIRIVRMKPLDTYGYTIQE